MLFNYIPVSDDIFVVADSNQDIDGLAGHDVAVFSGNRTDYTFTRLNDYARRVTGPDGAHTLIGIETYRFADGDYEWDFISHELIRPQEAPAGLFRLFTPDGFVGSIGGRGAIFGTNGFQSIGIIPGKNDISFDPSFPRGDDEIRFSGSSASFTAHISASATILSDAIGTVSLPYSNLSSSIWFGFEELGIVYSQKQDAVLFDFLTLTETPQSLVPNDGLGNPDGLLPQGSAKAFLNDEAQTVFGGNYTIFGTNADQHIVWRFGDISLDPSFGRGGDLLTIDAVAEDFRAYATMSSVVLVWGDDTAIIPIGTEGISLDFKRGDSSENDIRVLHLDAANGVILIGDQVITAISDATAVELHSFAGSNAFFIG